MDEGDRVMALPKKKPSMLRCSGCGTTQEAACDCGVGYMPAGGIAAMAIARSPEKSDRAIAEEIGVGHATVSRARNSVVSNETPDERIGRDGKLRSATKRPKLHVVPDDEMPTLEEVEEEVQATLYDQACLFLGQMTGETRRKYFAFITRKYPDEIRDR
jgi:hypothetical protein